MILLPQKNIKKDLAAINPLSPGDVIWRHTSGSKLVTDLTKPLAKRMLIWKEMCSVPFRIAYELNLGCFREYRLKR